LHTSQVSTALVAVLDALSGTRLRPSGGLYWLPARQLDERQRAVSAVESAAEGKPSAVYVLRHRLDAVRAVRDAIVAEVQAESARIHDEVVGGELGSRALETRRSEAGQLRQKIALYEGLLNVGLEGLYHAVDRADQAVAAAVLLASAQANGEVAAHAD
jgi:hypothetical protein